MDLDSRIALLLGHAVIQRESLAVLLAAETAKYEGLSEKVRALEGALAAQTVGKTPLSSSEPDAQ